MDKIEKIDIHNVLEVQRMKELLKDHKDLLTLFECMMLIINERLNNEKIVNCSERV
tara:strand:- start:2021 stop:2188 length:168 start_codon:yes stop_codon:yes gene_type:complete